jgi:hypothetical protein
MTHDQRNAIRFIAQTFIDTVKEMGNAGAPAGPMYAAVMDKLTLSQLDAIMGMLVAAGKLNKSGHVYHFVADL